MIFYNELVKKQVIILILALQFVASDLLSKSVEFSDFIQSSQASVSSLQKTLVFDLNQNQFRLVFCNETRFSYQQCLEYNYYLFSNFHVDSDIQKNSSFSRQLIRVWLHHRSSVYWLNLIFNDDLRYLKSNYYGVQKEDLKPHSRSDKFLYFPKELNSKYKASDEGLFSDDFTPLLFELDDRMGFSGQRNRVFFPIRKKQNHFSFSKQKIDFIAIINHELGHTRYGMEDSDSLIGEALVVRKFENPVRVYDGLDKRKYYFSPKNMKYINVETLEEFYISNSNSL